MVPKGGTPMAERLTLDAIEPKHLFCNIYGLPQRWQKGESWSFIGSPRPDHGFAFILCDEVYIKTKDGTERYFARGNLLYIPKGYEYYVEYRGTTGAYSDILVNFDIRDLAGGEYAFADEAVCLLKTVPPQLENDIEKLAEASTNLKYPALRVTRMFCALLESLLAHTMLLGAGGGSADPTAPARFYIDHHIGDKIAVAKLAKMCLLSESAFRKAFHAATGMSPAQYKMHAKIRKAQDLLAGTPELSIAEIADMLGFYDMSYFYKSFIAQVGITPGQYREAAQSAR